jgi:hypothetical protein
VPVGYLPTKAPARAASDATIDLGAKGIRILPGNKSKAYEARVKERSYSTNALLLCEKQSVHANKPLANTMEDLRTEHRESNGSLSRGEDTCRRAREQFVKISSLLYTLCDGTASDGE